MRDSIGGTVLFMIVLSMFFLFIIFMTFVIKYARAYKIKNSIVNYVERNEGVVSKDAFDNQLLKLGFATDGQYELCRFISPNKGGFYYVELYSRTTFPIVGQLISLVITIKGETRMIETGTRIRNTTSTESGSNNWFVSPNTECKICTVKKDDCQTVTAPDLGY